MKGLGGLGQKLIRKTNRAERVKKCRKMHVCLFLYTINKCNGINVEKIQNKMQNNLNLTIFFITQI